MMTEPAPRRDTVSCHVCGTVLGTINGGDRAAARRGMSSRVVTVEAGVKLFVNLAVGRAELICKHCGNAGRTLRADRIRGLILQLDEATDLAC